MKGNVLACRPMLSFALAGMAGAAAARVWPGYGSLLPYGCLVVAGLFLLFFRLPRRPVEPIPTLPDHYAPHIQPIPGQLASRGLNAFILILCLAVFLAGAARQEWWARAMVPDMLPEHRTVAVALIACEPQRQYDGQTGRWTVAALITAVNGKPCRPLRVRVIGADGPAFLRGDGLTARVRRLPERPTLHPGAFDAGLWMERDGLAATLWTTPAGVTVVPVASTDPFTTAMRWIDAVRSRAIAATLAHGGDDGPLLAAMLYGYRDAVPGEVRDAFRRVGIGHVLAISGLHVGLIIAMLWWLTGWFRWNARWRAVACLVLAVVYLGLSGGQVAAQRATLMAGIYLAGIAWGRRSDMLNSLGAAALIITLINPSAPFDVSFQLSFTAVVFIHAALYVPRTADRPRLRVSRWGRLRRELWSLIRLSVATWFGLFPIIAAVFNQLNVIGLFINILVIPMMSLVLQGGLLLPWLGWIPGLGWLLTLPSFLLTRLALWADSLPYASFPAHAPSGWWMAVLYGLVVCWLCRGLIRRYEQQRIYARVVGGLAALSFVGVVTSMGSSPPPTDGRLAVLPGRSGMPLVAAESGGGGIALVGALSANGLAEAGWLHDRRRTGEVALVLVGDDEVPSALLYHYPIAEETRLPRKGDFTDADAGWQPVPGASGIDYAVSRANGGGIAWLAVRTHGKVVVIAPRLAFRQFTWRLEHRVPGSDAELFVIGLREKTMGKIPAARVAVSRPTLDEYLPGWFPRDAYGVIQVDETIIGYDGSEWVVIDPPAQ